MTVHLPDEISGSFVKLIHIYLIFWICGEIMKLGIQLFHHDNEFVIPLLRLLDALVQDNADVIEAFLLND